MGPRLVVTLRRLHIFTRLKLGKPRVRLSSRDMQAISLILVPSTLRILFKCFALFLSFHILFDRFPHDPMS